MKIHKEGRKIVLVSTLVTILLVAAILWFVPSHHWAFPVALLIIGLFFIWILWFFRSPARHINRQGNTFLSPADGRVVVAEKVHESNYFGKEMQQISVFMSPLNVHLNRYPIDGKVLSYQYFPGKYLVAWHPKSSLLNERNAIVMEIADGEQLMVSQIAGTVARRIVCYSQAGERVKQGDELGFIKFGSRVDLYLPVGVELRVKAGDKVRAGLSVLAINGSKES